MKIIHKFYQIVSLLSLGIFAMLAGSGYSVSAQKAGVIPAVQDSTSNMTSEPRWLSEGCETFWSNDAKDTKGSTRLCAVAAAMGPGGISGLRSTAARRARNDIARVLEPEVEAIIEQYASKGQGRKEFGNPPDMERVRNLAALITETALRESSISGIWVPTSNRVHVLISIDAMDFLRTVENKLQLSDKLRAELNKSAEKGFRKISQKGEKVKNR